MFDDFCRYTDKFKLDLVEVSDGSMEMDNDVKCEYIAKMCNIHEGSKVLDLGCGWGGILQYLKKHYKIKETGVVLAEGQYKHCKETGLNVFHRDMREVKPEDFGTFDVVTASGSFDHVLSYEEFNEGKKEEIYRKWFDMVGQRSAKQRDCQRHRKS